MATGVQSPPEPGLASLVQGIVGDVGDLVKQQFRFAQAELKQDLHRTGEATRLLIIGVVLSLPGLFILCLTLVHLLHWLTLPAGSGYDPAGLPLWACYGIIGRLLLAVDGLLIYAGVKKFQSFNPLPDQTVEQVKENIECLTSSK